MKQESTDTQIHCILFTGHMIDKPNRPEPRFPAVKEEAARIAIRKALEKEKKRIHRPVFGLAGGACGGDILFHEVCQEIGISSELYLALPKEPFIEASVAFAGQHWVNRFNRLYQTLASHILLSSAENIPGSVWERVNEWMLQKGLSNGGKQMTLIALWDGKGGDGSGGTAHMVKQAREKGAHTVIIDVKELE